jgi:hypothetical protein
MVLFGATMRGSESKKTHDDTHPPSSARRPVVVGAQGVRDGYVFAAAADSARDRLVSWMTGENGGTVLCVCLRNGARLPLACIPRQRCLRADHNSTWRRATPPPQRSSCVQSRSLPAGRYGPPPFRVWRSKVHGNDGGFEAWYAATELANVHAWWSCAVNSTRGSEQWTIPSTVGQEKGGEAQR